MYTFTALIIEDSKLERKECVIWEIPENHLVVKIRAIGVNRADILQVRGRYPTDVTKDAIPGLEFSGEVLASCANKRNIPVGKKVCGLTASGAYAEMILIHEDLLIELPDEFSFEEGAAIPESWATAYFNLCSNGALSNDETVLIHSAGGGVGLAAVQLAVASQSRVIASTGSEHKARGIAQLGVSRIFNYREDAWSDLVREYSSEVNLVLDTIGGSALAYHLDLLSYQGRLLLIGLLGGAKSEINLGMLVRKNIKIHASTLRTQSLETKAGICRIIQDEFLGKIAQGIFKVHVSRVFPFNEVENAHAYILENQNFGNVVLSL
jgi:NADPH2:quinone reductase